MTTNCCGPTSCKRSDALRGTQPLGQMPFTTSVRATPGGATSGTTVTDATKGGAGEICAKAVSALAHSSNASASLGDSMRTMLRVETSLDEFMNFPFRVKPRCADDERRSAAAPFL